MMRSRPAPASRANKARSPAKNDFDTPFEMDRSTSPEMLWGRRWRDGTIVAGSNAMERPMAQQLDDLIPTRADHHALDALAQSRRPMDMMIQGWSMRRFQASQQ